MIPNRGDRVRINQRGDFYNQVGEVVTFNDCQERADIRFRDGIIERFDYKYLILLEYDEN